MYPEMVPTTTLPTERVVTVTWRREEWDSIDFETMIGLGVKWLQYVCTFHDKLIDLEIREIEIDQILKPTVMAVKIILITIITPMEIAITMTEQMILQQNLVVNVYD